MTPPAAGPVPAAARWLLPPPQMPAAPPPSGHRLPVLATELGRGMYGAERAI
jgi:hypothetical protein